MQAAMRHRNLFSAEAFKLNLCLRNLWKPFFQILPQQTAPSRAPDDVIYTRSAEYSLEDLSYRLSEKFFYVFHRLFEPLTGLHFQHNTASPLLRKAEYRRHF